MRFHASLIALMLVGQFSRSARSLFFEPLSIRRPHYHSLQQRVNDKIGRMGTYFTLADSLQENEYSSVEEASMMAIEAENIELERKKQERAAAREAKAAAGLNSSKAKVTKKSKPTTKKLEKKAKSPPTEEEMKQKYVYSDEDDEYDVPFIDEPMWYRMLVRKNSEKTLFEMFKEAGETQEGEWKDIVFDAFYPRSVLLKFKGKQEDGKGLSIAYRPMIPGLLFVKMRMDPDIADAIEAVNNVRGFIKAMGSGVVAPLNKEETKDLEKLQTREVPQLDEETKKLRIGEYCSIVGGKHEGRYGIIEGTQNGRVQVRLRSEYKDTHDAVEVKHLRFLANPPEVNYKDMTAKQAVESLMQKEPNAEILRYLRKEGLLNDILNPYDYDRAGGGGGGGSGGYSYGSAEDRTGREGGRSRRSIAKSSSGSWSRPANDKRTTTSTSTSTSTCNKADASARNNGGDDFDDWFEELAEAPSSFDDTIDTEGRSGHGGSGNSRSWISDSAYDELSAYPTQSSPSSLERSRESKPKKYADSVNKPWRRIDPEDQLPPAPPTRRSRDRYDIEGVMDDDEFANDFIYKSMDRPSRPRNSGTGSDFYNDNDGKNGNSNNGNNWDFGGFSNGGSDNVASFGANSNEDFDSFIEQMLNEADTLNNNNNNQPGRGSRVPTAAAAGIGAGSSIDDGIFDDSKLIANEPPINADRLDSEEVLNELIRDLGRKPVNSFKNNVDSKKKWPSRRQTSSSPPQPPPSSPSFMSIDDLFDDEIGEIGNTGTIDGNNRWDASSSSGGGVPSTGFEKTAEASTTAAPSMDEFGSFEAYLDALVNFEKSGTDGSSSGSSSDTGTTSTMFVEELTISSPPPTPPSSSPNRQRRAKASSAAAASSVTTAATATGSAASSPRAELESLSVKELKLKCKSAGLTQTGRKADLIQKLIENRA